MLIFIYGHPPKDLPILYIYIYMYIDIMYIFSIVEILYFTGDAQKNIWDKLINH